jgi:hypothetical protein
MSKILCGRELEREIYRLLGWRYEDGGRARGTHYIWDGRTTLCLKSRSATPGQSSKEAFENCIPEPLRNAHDAAQLENRIADEFGCVNITNRSNKTDDRFMCMVFSMGEAGRVFSIDTGESRGEALCLAAYRALIQRNNERLFAELDSAHPAAPALEREGE